MSLHRGTIGTVTACVQRSHPRRAHRRGVAGVWSGVLKILAPKLFCNPVLAPKLFCNPVLVLLGQSSLGRVEMTFPESSPWFSLTTTRVLNRV